MSKSPAHLEVLDVVRKNIVDIYQESRNLVIVQNILRQNINTLAEKSERGLTLFHYAAEKGDLQLFNLIFHEINLAIFRATELSYNQTISYHTALGKQISLAEAANVRDRIENEVKAQSDVLINSLINSFDEQGRTPASIAAKNLNVEMVSAFQDHGADITLSELGSPSAFSYLVQSPKKDAGILAVNHLFANGQPANITYADKLGAQYWLVKLHQESEGGVVPEEENHVPVVAAAGAAVVAVAGAGAGVPEEDEDDVMPGYSPARTLFSEALDADDYQAGNLNLVGAGAQDHDADAFPEGF